MAQVICLLLVLVLPCGWGRNSEVSEDLVARLDRLQASVDRLMSCTPGCLNPTADVTLTRAQACRRQCRQAVEQCIQQPDNNTACIMKCPDIGMCQGSQGREVWGTGLYTHDSGLCRSAVHSGVIPAAGGVFKVYVTAGLSSYQGSKAHGVVSNSYGPWGMTCRFEPVVET